MTEWKPVSFMRMAMTPKTSVAARQKTPTAMCIDAARTRSAPAPAAPAISETASTWAEKPPTPSTAPSTAATVSSLFTEGSSNAPAFSSISTTRAEPPSSEKPSICSGVASVAQDGSGTARWASPDAHENSAASAPTMRSSALRRRPSASFPRLTQRQ